MKTNSEIIQQVCDYISPFGAVYVCFICFNRTMKLIEDKLWRPMANNELIATKWEILRRVHIANKGMLNV